MAEDKGWVGIDLDGTLAIYDGWKGIEHIGEPIWPMVEYVQDLLEHGIDVRIFTARCQEGPAAIATIRLWCAKHLGTVLPVTDRKDFGMVFMVDDRAFTVEKNTGKFLTNPPSAEAVLYHYSPSNPDNPAYVGVK